MMSKQNQKSKKVAPSAFREVNKLDFDTVVGWDVKDMCNWLQKVTSHSLPQACEPEGRLELHAPRLGQSHYFSGKSQ